MGEYLDASEFNRPMIGGQLTRCHQEYSILTLANVSKPRVVGSASNGLRIRA